MQRRLVVTADDFGLAPGINRAVETAHREGILGSASLMVTAPAFADAVERARRMPDLSVGLHLVLCDGRAAAAPGEIPDLVDQRGSFRSSPLRAGLLYWRRRRRIRAQLGRELRAQFQRYLASGLPLAHLDSHHHLHMHPVAFDVLEPLLAEYAVPALRLPREDAAGRIRRGPTLDDAVAQIFFALARRCLRRDLTERGVAVADRVYGLRASGAWTRERLLALATRLDAERVELYTHPDEDSEAGRAERDALCDPSVRRAFESKGYRIDRSFGGAEPAGEAP